MGEIDEATLDLFTSLIFGGSLKCFPLFTSFILREWQSLTVEPSLEPAVGREASSGDPRTRASHCSGCVDS